MNLSIPGLYQLIKARREQAASDAVLWRDPATDPRDAHEAGVRAEAGAKQAESFLNHIQSNEKIIEGVEHMIHYLHKSPIQSTARSLAMHALEEASMRLHRENGDFIKF